MYPQGNHFRKKSQDHNFLWYLELTGAAVGASIIWGLHQKAFSISPKMDSEKKIDRLG